jgi:hypothetical protein
MFWKNKNIKTAAQSLTHAPIYYTHDDTDEIWMHEPQVRSLIQQYSLYSPENLTKLIEPDPGGIEGFESARNHKLSIFAPQTGWSNYLRTTGVSAARIGDRYNNLLTKVKLIPNEGQQSVNQVRPGHVVTVRRHGDPKNVVRKFVVTGNQASQEYIESMQKAMPGHTIITPWEATRIGLIGAKRDQDIRGVAPILPYDSMHPDKNPRGLGRILDIKPYQLPDSATDSPIEKMLVKSNAKYFKPTTVAIWSFDKKADDRASQLIEKMKAAGGVPLDATTIQSVLHPLSDNDVESSNVLSPTLKKPEFFLGEPYHKVFSDISTSWRDKVQEAWRPGEGPAARAKGIERPIGKGGWQTVSQDELADALRVDE